MVLRQRPLGGPSPNLPDRFAAETFAPPRDGHSTSRNGPSPLREKTPGAELSNFDLKVVHSLHNIFHQATDPTMGIPMLFASPVYHLGKVGLLKTFLARPATGWLAHNLTLKILPVLGGFGAETVAFSLSSRALSHYLQGPVPWDPASLIHDTAMTGLTLGLLKGAAFAGRKGMQWNRGLDEFKSQLWSQADRRAMFWTGQVSGYLGLVASHGLQGKLFPHSLHTDGNIWIDSLGTHLALGLVAHGGRHLLGARFQTLEQGLAHQAHRLSQEIRFSFPQAGALAPARGADYAALGGRHGGRHALYSLPHGPTEGFKQSDLLQRIIQEARKRASTEIFDKCFSGKTDEELYSLIQGELNEHNRLSAKESKLIQIIFFSDPPKTFKELGQDLGVSPERAKAIVRKINEQIINRLAYRLYPSEDPFDIPVEVFPGSVRVRNFIKNKDIKTLGQLTQWTENDLLRLENMGQKSLDQLKALLAERGLFLATIKGQRQKAPLPLDLTVLDQPIDELLLPSRIENIVDKMKIRYVGELVQTSETDFLKTKGAGRRSLNFLAKLLAQRNLQLGMEVGAWKPPGKRGGA